MGYWSTHLAQNFTISSEVCSLLSDFLENVLALRLVVEFAGCRIERDADLCARLVAGLGDGFEHHFKRFFVRFQVGGESTFVAHRGGITALLQHALQSVEHFDAHAQRFGKFACAVAGRS